MNTILTRTLRAALAALALTVGVSAVQAQSKQAIATTGAPTAIGPYSQAIKFGDTLYLSGQIPIDPKTNTVLPATSTIEEQTTVVMENLKAVLAANGMTFADVLSTTVYMKDLNEFGKMNALYATYFKDTVPPARATLEVARIPRDVKIEIAAIARK
jgi:2-iminobutanoate/2-iminopropanoate deaminase